MARKLRIQFEGAIYHIINRGNYRRDVFENAATAKAFETTLDETCERHHWRLHAYVIMRNHYHLALETPGANLVDGMHWLQSTFSTRFNRLRSERGHLFQGRYHSLLVENASALARVVDYLHLNPVRAGIVEADRVADFRWSSLQRFLKSARPAWLVASDWLAALQLQETKQGWANYLQRLQAIAAQPAEMERLSSDEFSRGWAIGTHGWRQVIAREHAQLALSPGLESEQLKSLREARWQSLLDETLRTMGKTKDDLQSDRKGAAWKIATADRLRREGGASHRWLATNLAMGGSNSVRSYLSRLAARSKNQQLSA